MESPVELPVAAPDMFVNLDEDEAYAGTSYLDWHCLATATTLENFKTLKLEDIEPENQSCEICFEPFDSSENPVQILSCGHVFGHICLSSWLAEIRSNWPSRDSISPSSSDMDSDDSYEIDPEGEDPWLAELRANWTGDPSSDPLSDTDSHCSYEEDPDSEFLEAMVLTDVDDADNVFQDDDELRFDWRDHLNWVSDDENDLRLTDWLSPEVGDGSCPKCRGKFLLVVRCERMAMRIAAHIEFWDKLYEKLGISRSAKEEQSRTDLMRYVQMVELPPRSAAINSEDMRGFTLQAQASAMRFALRRGKRDLDPLQTYLRDAIFNLGCYGLREWRGEYRANSYENRRVPLWCYAVDHLERGRRLPHDSNSYWSFNHELNEQISGPWRRKLFAEIGG